MTPRHWLLFVLIALGCAPTIHIHPETPGSEALLKEAGKVVGIRTKIVDASGPGVIDVEVRSQEGRICGQALEKVVGADSLRDAVRNGVVNCQPKAWTCDHVTYAAHELGHVIGLLPHVDQDDPKTAGNLMRPGPEFGATLDDQQTLRVQAVGAAFNATCR